MNPVIEICVGSRSSQAHAFLLRIVRSLSVLLLMCCLPAEAVTVSNVRATQRVQTQLVDIFYDLSATNSGPFSVSITVSTNNGATYDLQASSVTGSGIDTAVTPGTRKQIVWNAGVDWPQQYSSAVRFKITASEIPTTGDYLVIDLSAGPESASYPVTYMTAVPSGGWTDEYKTTKMVLRRIPAGTFIMGSPSDELGRELINPSGEQACETQHQVTLTQPFYLGIFEVTQKQWERVMGTWPAWFNNVAYRDSRPVEQVRYNDIRGSSAGAGWPDNHSVDADSFMGRLRSRTGRAFDLPTESQWEYAGRAGTSTALNSGYNLTSTISDAHMAEVGRYWHNGGNGYTQNGDASVGTAQVGSYLPNAWGLYDIHGNVWEWCLDWYGTYPSTVNDPRGATTGSHRVVRSGIWDNNAHLCRAAFRGCYPPDFIYSDGVVGFRIALPSTDSSLNNGLVAYYPFNGNANDESGNGHSGTVVGATLTTDRFGQPNAAYHLDGASYIAVPSFRAPGASGATVSVWAKPERGYYSDIISKHTDTSGCEFNLRMEQDGKYDLEWTIGGTFYDLSRTITGQFNDNTGIVLPSYDRFDLVTATYDGAYIRLYINDSCAAYMAAGGSIVSNSLPLGIGWFTPTDMYHGVLDDVRFYNRALSAAEVQQLYTKDVP